MSNKCDHSGNSDWDGKCIWCRTSSEEYLHSQAMLAISKMPARETYSLAKHAMQELYDNTRKGLEQSK